MQYFGDIKKKIMIVGVIVIIALTVILIFDSLLFPLPMERLRKPSAAFVYSRDKNLLGCFTSTDSYWRKPIKLESISPLLQKSVIACEDRWFYYHPGVNLFSLVSAAVDNLRAGKVVRGGSTITMQVARMMEPKSRTLKAKIIEILRAFQLEMHFSKRELLELYFNLAPYGGNIEGVGAAAYFYFGKTPIDLTAAQAAMLTSVPNSPTALRPDLNYDRSAAARSRALDVMRKRGIISENLYREALAEEIRPRKTEPPQIARHFTRGLALQYPDNPEIISSLDLRIQNICDGVVKNHKNELAQRGINNIAVTVIKNSTGELLGMVGSADFGDYRHQGQVNGAMSPRSPGSALKPFVYAMALDQGLLSPHTILEDLPIYYSGYSPENYDKEYRGVVSAADALRLSLNVPAVYICYKVGQRNFYNLLKSGGISSLYRKDYDYGLPIILGSCEVRLIDLTNLYSSLGRGGLYYPYHLLKNDSPGDTLRLFSPGASYLISEILSELERPDFPASWEFSPNIPKVAWKTGTSYGRKDAWSVGYNTEYAVGVWVGNFSGESSPDLVGADAAAPLLFEIFKAISAGRNSRWFAPAPEVSSRLVCSVSGLPPNDFCPGTIEEFYLPGISPSGKCNIHQQILVDSISGYRLCRFCTGKNAREMTVEKWPPKIATWVARSGRALSTIPEHNPSCTGAYASDKPVIISPHPDVTYLIRDYLPLEQQEIALEASAASDSRELFWFIDGDFLGKVAVGERMFYRPQRGVHQLVCADNDGRATSISLKIE